MDGAGLQRLPIEDDDPFVARVSNDDVALGGHGDTARATQLRAAQRRRRAVALDDDNPVVLGICHVEPAGPVSPDAGDATDGLEIADRGPRGDRCEGEPVAVGDTPVEEQVD